GRDLSAAVRMWGGYYLNSELSSLGDADAGKYTAAFTLKLAEALQLKPGDRSMLAVSGLHVTAGKTYTVTVTAYSLSGESVQTMFKATVI
ncbi:MAG: hypothetical protein ACP5LQ_09285, partial [Candidatus Methanodesulfokora sp.]